VLAVRRMRSVIVDAVSSWATNFRCVQQPIVSSFRSFLARLSCTLLRNFSSCGALTHVQSSAIHAGKMRHCLLGQHRDGPALSAVLFHAVPATAFNAVCARVSIPYACGAIFSCSQPPEGASALSVARVKCVCVRHVATLLTCVDGQRQHGRDAHLPALFLYTGNSQRSAWLLAPRPASCVCGCLLHTLDSCQGVMQLASGWWDRFCGGHAHARPWHPPAAHCPSPSPHHERSSHHLL
jgi:hypothetical protein